MRENRQRAGRGSHFADVDGHPPRNDVQNRTPLSASHGRPDRIGSRPRTAIMCRGVDLDPPRGVTATQIRHVRPNGMVALNVRARLSTTSTLPCRRLGKRQRLSWPTYDRYFGAAERMTPLSTRRAGPLPHTGKDIRSHRSTTLRAAPCPMHNMPRIDKDRRSRHRLPSTSSASNRWIAAGSALRLTFNVIGVDAPATHRFRSLSRSNVPALSTEKRVIDR